MIDSETVVGTGLRITVSKDDLASRLAIVARGVSTRTAVLVLGGIQLRAEAGRLHLASTDMELSLPASLAASVDGDATTLVPRPLLAAPHSYRLAVQETAVPATLPDLEAIIPARALQELARIAGGADELQLGLLDNHVVFGAEGTWLTTRRIDGQFPNYRQLLPEQFEHEVLLPREEALEAVRRVSLMAQRN